MKYKSKLGTIINIPDNASPADVARIKARADSGYGTDAQKIANSLAKATSTGKTSTGTTTNTVGQNIDATLNKDGSFDLGGMIDQLVSQANSDYSTQFNSNNVNDETDANGNTIHRTRDATTGAVTSTITPGAAEAAALAAYEAAKKNKYTIDPTQAPKVLTGADLADQRKSVYDSLFNQSTQYYGKQKTQDLEDKKQELANRGIPYDPSYEDPNDQSGYAKGIQSITNKYDQLYSSAMDQANAGADARVKSQVDASTEAANSWWTGQDVLAKNSEQGVQDASADVDKYKGNFTPFQGGGSFDTTKYITQMTDLFNQGKISAAQLAEAKSEFNRKLSLSGRSSGGSSGGSKSGGGGNTSPVFPGDAPGFSV